MKKLMITGALLGYCLGLVLGLLQQSSWPSILWRASVACFVSAVLMRWWGQMWVKSWQIACYQKLVANQEAARQAKKSQSKP
jgi:hypothetical protein